MPLLELATGCNGGLALGYNLALRELGSSYCDYVLFLNADSEVTDSLLNAYESEITRVENEDTLVFAPTLVAGERVVSPFAKPGFGHEFFIIGFMLCHRSLFPPGFEFPSEFWLDGIDYWLSHRFATTSVPVRRVPVTIQHRLSVADGFRRLPAWRYRNILLSELRFYRAYEAPAWAAWRLLARGAVKTILNGRLDLLREVWRAFREHADEGRSALAH